MGQDARVDVLLALKAKLEGFDGAATAVPGLSAAVSKAGAEIKEKARTIGDDVDHIGDRMRKAFDPANLAKGFLAGAGVGSGVALVGLTFEKWRDVWKESADYAKDLEERANNIATAMQATAKAAREAFVTNLPAAQQLAARQKEVADLQAKMTALETTRSNSVGALGFIYQQASETQLGQAGASNFGFHIKKYQGETFGGPNDMHGIGAKDFTDLMQKRADDAQLAWTKARDDLIKAQADVAKLKKDIADVAAKTAETNLLASSEQRASLQFSEGLSPDQQAKGAAEIQKRLKQMDEEFAKNDYAAAVDRARLARLANGNGGSLMALNETTPDQEVAAADAAKKALADVSAEGRAFDRDMAQLWNSVSDRAGQAFADILIDGTNSFKDLGREIIKSITEIAVRMAIINPILNGIFGGFKGFDQLPTFASSGAPAVKAAGGGSFVTRGRTHFTVGDNPGGIELVSVLPLSGVGRSSINGRNIALAGGGSALVGAGGRGGDNFNFSYAFHGGVSRAEVMGLLPSLVEASKSAVLEAKRRGRGGF